jgi:hypothetical protein
MRAKVMTSLGLETVDSRTAKQLLKLGFDASTCRYTAEELVQATAGAALTVADYLRLTRPQAVLQQAA